MTRSRTSWRWLFADQLGPHFLGSEPGFEGDDPVLLIESRAVFRRRRFHRQKAHLVLSALRHRAAELGDRARFVRADTYGAALDKVGGDVTVCHPTSRGAAEFVRRLDRVEVLPARGFVTSGPDFDAWVAKRGRRRLLLDDFYRDARVRHDVLMDGDLPAGGRWNFDSENREPPPRDRRTLGVPPPPWPQEDEIDEQVRADLDRWERDGDVSFVGRDGPRWAAATRAEALRQTEHFLRYRLSAFGTYQDVMLEYDPTMAHSGLSSPLNLGLIDPIELVERVEGSYRRGSVPLSAAEGFIRQVIGWRDYVWHLYWHRGPGYARSNMLNATRPVPAWLAELDADAVPARCLSTTLRQVRDRGWTHHIPRLMILGNYALQRGIDPAAMTDWFHRCFVDGYDWVMAPNVVGMALHADGGMLATKPYAAGGNYINRMSDLCVPCEYRPDRRLGDDACPYTAGYWALLDRHRETFAQNNRMRQPLRGLDRLADLDAVVEQERHRGTDPP